MPGIVHRNLSCREWGAAEAEALTTADLIEHCGLTRLDRGPLAMEDHPLSRSLLGETVDDELLMMSPDGWTRHVLMHSRPLQDAGGSRVGAVCSAYDITDLREYEAELQNFAGVVAHDLRSPLTAVKGYLEIVTEMLSGEEPCEPIMMRRSVEKAALSADRMSSLISDLLGYVTARDATPQLARVDLGELVKGVVEERTDHLRAVDDGMAPQIVCGPMPVVMADAAMLRQVLDNLVGNAIKYTAHGERPRVEITARDLGRGWAQVAVADHGIGIPVDQRDKIFKSFHRAHRGDGYAGTGLGLSICKRIVERHGGAIWVGENPGGGSCFYVNLPAGAGGATGTPPAVLEPPAATGDGAALAA